ncbi:MAG: hypothetical protein Q8L88_00195 [Bacteroidota bacterium]|nr:hypothetical protein [Bacteroidota bacterium]
MKTLSILALCIIFIGSSVMNAQEHAATQAGKNLRIQKLVRDVLGKTVTLNFKDGEPKTGTLIRANGIQFTLEIDDKEEIFQTETIRSYTLKAGLGEGILVFLSAGFVAGFGVGAAALSFEGMTSTSLSAIGVVFGIIGGWLGYESFFQDVEVEIP